MPKPPARSRVRRFLTLRALWTSARHLVAFAATSVALVAIAFVAVTPMLAVFVIDGAEITADDTGSALLWVAGVVVAALVLAGVVTPVGILLELLAGRLGTLGYVLAALLPVGLVAGIVVGALGIYQVFVADAGTSTGSRAAYYAALGGVLLLVALLVYWVALWGLRILGIVVQWGVRRYRRSRATAGAAAPGQPPAHLAPTSQVPPQA